MEVEAYIEAEERKRWNADYQLDDTFGETEGALFDPPTIWEWSADHMHTKSGDPLTLGRHPNILRFESRSLDRFSSFYLCTVYLSGIDVQNARFQSYDTRIDGFLARVGESRSSISPTDGGHLLAVVEFDGSDHCN